MRKTINLFSRVLCALMLCAGIIMTGCAKINDALEDYGNRLDNLEGVQIKSLKEQISSINVSLKGLQTVDAALQKLIDNLEAEAADLQTQLDANSAADAATKKALEDEIASIKALITALQSKDAELDQKIADLRTYVDNELKSTEDWANATFATLTQYEGVQTEIAAIKALIEQYKTDITAAYTKAIEDAIAASETSMKAWVNETLANGYYDIVAIDGKIAALQITISTGDEALQEELSALSTSLEQAKSELTEAYKAAIEEAINTNNGVIRGEIASSIADAKEELETSINSIESRLTEIESKVSGLEQKIEEILSMIQSVVFIPKYSDGAVHVDDILVEMSFKISPSSAVTTLADVWEQSLSIKYVTTIMTKSSPTMKNIQITSAEFDDNLGIVTLVADCKDLELSFFEATTSASVALFISDGSTSISSDFIPFVLEDPSLLEIMKGADLAVSATANSYIISQTGVYKFPTVKGNSSESVGTVDKAEVLWESFGTDVAPSVGDLVKNVTYKDGYIAFEATDKKGNAVIAAKDADGKILWSWHIWLTDQPEGQVYSNNAGTMMDRNLGATSATPGDVGALGLLYQWGRKDPFLGSSSISSSTVAKSTLTWPSAVETTSYTGTIDYVTANPTTFVTDNSYNYDWHYGSRDNTLWQSEKTINDPCPAGWRVPDGGDDGVWSKASGSSSDFYYSYDSTNKGMNFSGKFGSSSTIWYPASGVRDDGDGGLYCVGDNGRYWSVTPSSYDACYLIFSNGGYVYPSNYDSRALGFAVRCLKEGTGGGSSESEIFAKNLSISGTANSYIVSESGAYKFRSTKGNSTTSVGTVASADVLWETFGTDVTPNVGDLIKNVTYKDGYITFEASEKKGNAVIAAKDASGKILWSWHIWLTDQPQGQEYYNNAGTMMDRNLGATSATPGDVGALGLLYQWGRKDPFLGSSSISSSTVAKSTLSWPSAVESTSSTGTIDYVTANPTTYVYCSSSSNDYDWHYGSRDNTLWQSSKTIYDPCPSGWRVPDGGSSGVWSTALGSSSSFRIEELYDSTNEGMNFSGKFGSSSTIWYPASGYRNYHDGVLNSVGRNGYYWSVTPISYYASYLSFYYNGDVYPSLGNIRASGQSVRCLQVID